jgi:hypothetical protein
MERTGMSLENIDPPCWERLPLDRPVSTVHRYHWETRLNIALNHATMPSMRKHFPRIITCLVVTMLLAAFTWPIMRPQQPTYQVKTFITWLDQYSNPTPTRSRDTAQTAIQSIGTNAIPILLKMIRTRDSALERTAIKLLRKQSLIPLSWRTEAECHTQACLGFRLLGLNAASAAADLTDLVMTAPDPAVRASAARALNFIVPQADTY